MDNEKITFRFNNAASEYDKQRKLLFPVLMIIMG